MFLEDLEMKKLIIDAAKTKFSSETQTTRKKSIDRIVEQSIFLNSYDKEISFEKIESKIHEEIPGEALTLPSHEILNSLERLITQKRVEKTEKGVYKLTRAALTEIENSKLTSEKKMNDVVNKLFRDPIKGSTYYKEPFIEFLCFVFSETGEIYASLLVETIPNKDYFEKLISIIPNAIVKIKENFLKIDEELFKKAVLHFFKVNDPDFASIKWDMAQSYYITKLLGIDKSGFLLTKEVFGNSTFYLDTNVIIDAVEPEARHHNSFNSLSTALKNQSIQLKVCQVTIDQLRNLIPAKIDTIQKVEDQIPKETESKIRDIFYDLYLMELNILISKNKNASFGDIDFNTVFSNFYNALSILEESHNLKLVDDNWFDDSVNNSKVLNLTRDIMKTSADSRRQSRKKGFKSAFHDAQILEWIRNEREKENSKHVWFLTLDTSLVNFHSMDSRDKGINVAITLDALLHWISPLTIEENLDTNFSIIFSEVIKNSLFPHKKFFDIEDFAIFSNLGISCKELPSEDVENCITYLKSHAPNLNPSNSSDREEIAYEINKFFLNTGRQYKNNLKKYEAEIKKKDGKIEKRDKEIEDITAQLKEFTDNRSKDKATIEDLKLEKSTNIRLAFIALVLLFGFFLLFVLYTYHGDGAITITKLFSFMEASGLWFAAITIISYFILGKERIRKLPYPLSLILKKDKNNQ